MPQTSIRAVLVPALMLGLVGAMPPGVAAAGPVNLKEAGSTLVQPLFETWAKAYGKIHPDVVVSTEGGGSEKGIADAVEGRVQIGTSDAFLSTEQVERHPGVLDIALAISAQTVDYNIPGFAGVLKLDGPVLAGIYSGTVRFWDDRAITALNAGANLPHHAIVPVRRADGSGDTFVFTQYLSFTTGAEETPGFLTRAASWETSPGFGTTIDWPRVAGEQTATGNAGVVDTLAKTPFSLGYVGISFAEQVARAKLGTAEMKSNFGEFLLPTPATIAAAAASLTPRTPDDERLTLVNAPGKNCYPLINYEYAVVTTTQASAPVAADLRRFLQWAIAPDEQNAGFIEAEHFIPLPAHIWVKSHDQIEAIR